MGLSLCRLEFLLFWECVLGEEAHQHTIPFGRTPPLFRGNSCSCRPLTSQHCIFRGGDDDGGLGAIFEWKDIYR
uniref:Putative secreted protein n=1 Tax=Anopheles darlingi TaxID=43151 RepID=A0A2M4DJN8_ANODA